MTATIDLQYFTQRDSYRGVLQLELDAHCGRRIRQTMLTLDEAQPNLRTRSVSSFSNFAAPTIISFMLYSFLVGQCIILLFSKQYLISIITDLDHIHPFCEAADGGFLATVHTLPVHRINLDAPSIIARDNN